MGAKNRKTPTFEKTQIFRSKNSLTLEKTFASKKTIFEKEKMGGGGDPPKFFLLLKYVFSIAHWKKMHFREKNAFSRKKFLGAGPSLDPQI